MVRRKEGRVRGRRGGGGRGGEGDLWTAGPEQPEVACTHRHRQRHRDRDRDRDRDTETQRHGEQG
eukprot:2918430-Rhodomonas_salina.1